MSNARKSVILIISILIIDQIIKILVKANMSLGQEILLIGEFARLRFIENNGMAFGMEFGGTIGKILLSLFRIVAVGAIGWYIANIIKKNAPQGVVLGMSAVFAGAVGNILDSMFYGIIFGESGWLKVAEMFPADGGYAPFLFGKVVDMFYFPIIDGIAPKWLPFLGGEHIIFFRPVFNFADAAITCGVAYLILFQRNYFKKL